jgi:hypothetical protein
MIVNAETALRVNVDARGDAKRMQDPAGIRKPQDKQSKRVSILESQYLPVKNNKIYFVLFIIIYLYCYTDQIVARLLSCECAILTRIFNSGTRKIFT